MRKVLALTVLFVAVSCVSQTVVITEQVKELKPTGSLGTCNYTPASDEKKSFEKLAPEEQATGSFMAPYDIHKKNGYVSWFGVVRGISKDSSGKVRLLLQHNYFDGMTDCHIMMVSHPGSGDFLAELSVAADVQIPSLALVRVYGTVSGSDQGRPVLNAEFVRVWPWMSFTFTDLSASDNSNPRWKKYCKRCSGGRVYVPYPTEDYYRSMLGNPDEFGVAFKP